MALFLFQTIKGEVTTQLTMQVQSDGLRGLQRRRELGVGSCTLKHGAVIRLSHILHCVRVAVTATSVRQAAPLVPDIRPEVVSGTGEGHVLRAVRVKRLLWSVNAD